MIDYTLPLEELADPLPIEPLSRPFDVTITPPGSKSITNRAYVLAALADGESRIIRPLRSDDCDNLLNALCTLGAEARWEGEDVFIRGVNGRFPRGGSVNLGDGGAPTRFMIACACLAAEPVIVDGSPRMRQRPIAEGVDMLRQLGAHIEYVEEEGRLPVRVVPSEDLKGGKLTVGKTSSSQFVSAVLLIGACLPRGIKAEFTTDVTSVMYVRLTYSHMSAWKLSKPYVSHRDVSLADGRGLPKKLVVRRSRIRCRSLAIEPDASSAVYWLLAACLIPAARVKIPDLPHWSEQPDLQAYLLLHGRVKGDFGAEGPVDRESFCIDASMMPDASLALAAYAATVNSVRSASNRRLAESLGQPQPDNLRSTITGLHTLRVKETDRIAALANELRRIGCTVETTEDSITIDPSTRHDEPVIIETYNDHRMAMAFGVLGLARPGISIRNPKCVKKSYPGFWADFAKLYQ